MQQKCVSQSVNNDKITDLMACTWGGVIHPSRAKGLVFEKLGHLSKRKR